MLKLNKRKKSPRRGLGKSIENLCIKFEQVKATKGRDYGSDPAKRRKKKAAKRSSKRRDPAVKRRRAIRRPFIRSAVGPWRDGADPSWFGHPRLHKKAAKKGVRRAKRKTVKRDPAWFGHPRLHAKAARKGARRKKAAKRRPVRRDPSWFGHARAHSKAAKKGVRRKARKGSKRRSPAQIAATKRMLAGLRASKGRSPARRRKASPTRRRATRGGGMSYRDAMRGL
jgi:hypothetical protein